jgi:hypothetical protein
LVKRNKSKYIFKIHGKTKNIGRYVALPQTITGADTGSRVKFMNNGSLVKTVILK